MSQNIDSLSSVLDGTLSAKILTCQFREIAKRSIFFFSIVFSCSNISQVSDLFVSIFRVNYLHGETFSHPKNKFYILST